MPASPVSSVVVVGYGVIGASVARAVKQRAPDVRVDAVDHAAVLGRGEAARVVDGAIAADDQPAIDAAVASAELVVLAAPVRVIEAQLPSILSRAKLVTDCGSTKRSIVAVAAGEPRSGCFVAGHPMAGRPRGGPEASSPDLFVDQTWILCREGALAECQRRVASFVRFLGARVVEMSAEEHDRCVALTSHLPQLLASLLLVSAHERQASDAAGPAFHSATRVAGGNLSMWRDIFGANSDCIGEVTALFAQRLNRIASALERGDVSAAVELLQAARSVRGDT